jgi:hypothetical protein
LANCQYDLIAGKETSNSIGNFVVTVMGVNILPSELPLESSTHLGNAVQEVLEEFAAAKTETGIDVSKLSPR